MKNLFTFLLVTMLAFSIAGCATLQNAEKTKVKCPACGYHFDAPATR
jgi:hypothetical protein